MKGKHFVSVKNNVLQYQFELRRNITIIKGNSASGKTTLVDMIREYYNDEESSGITLQCDKTCAVLEGRQWKLLLENTKDSIVFIDEGNKFISTNEFATAVKESDNYFVIITREKLPNLPYSVDEIYGIRQSGKYGLLHQTYQEFYHIYGDYHKNITWNPDVVIVEDSNSGYEFFSEVSKEKTFEVVSAKGKSNTFKKINEYEKNKILIIADGAAFGAEMDGIVKKIRENNSIAMYLPESFEWLILKSDLINSNKVKNILEEPSDYVESKDYMSWERFFTALLVEETKDTYLRYSKSNLNSAYKNEKIMNKILKEVPEELLD